LYPETTGMGATTFNEAVVLLQARKGDRAAFGSLVQAYQRRAYVTAYGFVGNRDDALELAQEAFARAFKAMHRFKPGLPFYPWLHRIIRNTCLNHLKKKRRHGETSLDAMMDSGFDARDQGRGPAQEAALNDLGREIGAALKRLNPEHAEILTLRHFQELSYDEIARCLGIPKGTVMSRLHAARCRLRDELDPLLQREVCEE